MQEPKKSRPNTIAHYTTLAGFQGILKSETLFASHALFLNDKEELYYALRAAGEFLQKTPRRSSLHPDPGKMAKTILNAIEGDMPDVYVTCFCEAEDSLVHWRGYGGQVQGISLVFNLKTIIKNMSAERAFFRPVSYPPKPELIAGIENMIRSSDDWNDVIAVDELNRETLNNESLVEILAVFKHPGFKDEKEWRLFCSNSGKKLLYYREKDNMLVPYVVLKWNNQDQNPLQKIIIGPGKEMALTKKSIEHYRDSFGTKYKHVPVQLSEVPYRP